MLTPTTPAIATPSLRGWHFAISERKTRYSNEPIIEGKTLSASGPLCLCENGMHASLDILDALHYAPGPILSLVKLSGFIIRGSDKVCARHRKHLRVVDITPQLQKFALWCAEEVLPIFEKQYPTDNRPKNCIEITRNFLKGKATRKELLAARDATYGANSSAYYAAAAAASVANVAYYAVLATTRQKTRDKQRKKLLSIIRPLFEGV